MAKVTWKGEDELHNDDRGGPSFMMWNGIKFPKDKAVEVTDERMIAKARANTRFFEVEGKEKGAIHDKVSPPATVEGSQAQHARGGTRAPLEPRHHRGKKHDDEDQD